jgi:hypothetical protein
MLNIIQDNINILQNLTDNDLLGMCRSATVPSFSAHISQYVSTFKVIFGYSIATSASDKHQNQQHVT